MNKFAEERLKTLFEFAPPDSLRKSLIEVFFSFLLHNRQHFPADFERITEDFYFLIDFLELIEQDLKTNSP